MKKLICATILAVSLTTVQAQQHKMGAGEPIKSILMFGNVWERGERSQWTDWVKGYKTSYVVEYFATVKECLDFKDKWVSERQIVGSTVEAKCVDYSTKPELVRER